MAKPIYSEQGIDVLDNGKILLIRCPKCKRENYALSVIDGVCAWCGFDAHKDEGLKERMLIHSNLKRLE